MKIKIFLNSLPYIIREKQNPPERVDFAFRLNLVKYTSVY